MKFLYNKRFGSLTENMNQLYTTPGGRDCEFMTWMEAIEGQLAQREVEAIKHNARKLTAELRDLRERVIISVSIPSILEYKQSI